MFRSNHVSFSELSKNLLSAAAQEFAISEDKLIQLAKDLFAKESGLADESLLADDFRFEFPVVSLDREVWRMHERIAHAATACCRGTLSSLASSMS